MANRAACRKLPSCLRGGKRIGRRVAPKWNAPDFMYNSFPVYCPYVHWLCNFPFHFPATVTSATCRHRFCWRKFLFSLCSVYDRKSFHTNSFSVELWAFNMKAELFLVAFPLTCLKILCHHSTNNVAELRTEFKKLSRNFIQIFITSFDIDCRQTTKVKISIWKNHRWEAFRFVQRW